MKTFVFIFLFLISNVIFSQKYSIKVTNSTTNKEVLIKEKKSIRIKTMDGKKISGRVKIINKDSILIKNNKIALTDIIKLKRHPFFVYAPISGILLFYSSAITGLSLLGAIFLQEPVVLLLTIPAFGMAYLGASQPNILKSYKKGKGWKYEIVVDQNLPEKNE